MKDFILKGISFVFHPLIMPILGVIFYFSKTPRFIPEAIVMAKLFSIVNSYNCLTYSFIFSTKNNR